MKRTHLLFLLSVLAGPIPAQDRPTEAQLAEVARRIEADWLRRDAPSVAVAIAWHGEVLWEAAFGWADREAQVRATPQTVYALASVTKPMTASGVMRLVEKGAVELERPANDYLAASLRAMVGNADDATIRTLANHTSGLTTMYNLYFDDEVTRPASREESIRRWGVLMSPPGERHEYSNFGYGLLDHIIARVSGKSFAEFMADEVFAPLGMDSTSVGRPDLGARVAVRYMADGAPFPQTLGSGSGSGGIYSSVRDLVRFGMFHLGDLETDGPPVLTSASLAEMQRPTITARLPFVDVGYAIGWRTWRSAEGDHLVVQHTGLMEGATANLTLLPEEGLVIAALVNEAGFLAQGAVDIAGEELLGPRYLDAPKRAPDNPAAVAELLSSLAGEWRGTVKAYDGEVPIEVRLRATPAMQVRFDGGAWTDARGVTARGNTLSGTFDGERVPDSEWRRWPTNMTLTFRKEGERVTATLFADAVADPVKGVPFGFTLWVALEKAGGR